MIRVLLVDDHHALRLGMEQLLTTADDIEIVGGAAGGEQALELAVPLAPQVVLMDLSMPGMSGIEATRRILDLLPDVAVVVLTSFADEDMVVDAIEAGAIGYLLKDAEPDELIRAVRAAARGESPMDPRAARTILTRRSVAVELSAREREVLTLVARGLANKQIGRALGITEHTVKAHLTSIFAQLGVNDRTSAAMWAQRHGLTGRS
ncbi:response regulator [Pseudonocardia hydrocarbonoxydans]|uniref:Transcriptional regulatory protein LiaR n=1 Tax=Pseudonocardia hydrocarbonoxydans TaxID=76726 RepID=A0A4Y3WH02_9PSEU|nr:response regulator transcription factor [Pseudonocardia hydrocarbonoxydans]GEC18277.1 transcriptional regulatory protein LiaR [Pseudonocardia hydrocarbonoxydans]